MLGWLVWCAFLMYMYCTLASRRPHTSAFARHTAAQLAGFLHAALCSLRLKSGLAKARTQFQLRSQAHMQASLLRLVLASLVLASHRCFAPRPCGRQLRTASCAPQSVKCCSAFASSGLALLVSCTGLGFIW